LTEGRRWPLRPKDILEVFRARGHDPVLDEDGKVDFFVTNPKRPQRTGLQDLRLDRKVLGRILSSDLQGTSSGFAI
jgi:hypothetical protein